jgi:hypothetical protein
VEPRLPPSLAAAREALVGLTRSVAALQREEGLDVEPEAHVAEVLHCGLMEVRAGLLRWRAMHVVGCGRVLLPPAAPRPSRQVVYEWARGTPFAAITELTDVMEGSIVRAMVRLDGACRELQDAARVMVRRAGGGALVAGVRGAQPRPCYLARRPLRASVGRHGRGVEAACRSCPASASAQGNTSLFQLAQAASAAIKRDVIFAASLYVA